MLHTKYQVVYPFPTFQPAFQLKKDQVVLLNTSYSLVACAVSVHSAGRPCGLMAARQRVKRVLSLPHHIDKGPQAQRGGSPLPQVTQPGRGNAGVQTWPRLPQPCPRDLASG